MPAEQGEPAQRHGAAGRDQPAGQSADQGAAPGQADQQLDDQAAQPEPPAAPDGESAPFDLLQVGGMLFAAGQSVGRLGRQVATELSEVTDSLRAAQIPPDVILRVAGELAAEILRFLRIDLVGMIIDAWAQWPVIREAARRCAASPQATETLILGSHTSTAEYGREADILAGELLLTRTRIRLIVEFTLTEVSIALRAGRLTRAHPGAGRVSLTLLVADRTIRQVERDLPLPASIPLGDGIPIVRLSRTTEPDAGRGDDAAGRDDADPDRSAPAGPRLDPDGLPGDRTDDGPDRPGGRDVGT
ncbi:hypothetical protein ND748_23540 [Frankia sp. AiPs1]|uniref:hypothetical protein n=1 Tax=Frankia sp. AiPs1 TaxID=573493 RepID=UPI002043B6FF|nr:hypothetical protein [Frankia sp. AiPs1]MCM3924625.1 hypothetical protein [Frankia sp. AiPs1]